MEGWTRNLLSMAGRRTLVQSIVCALGVHIMSVLPIPCSVLKEAETLMAEFIWGTDKHQWISKEKIMMDIDKGGFGITPMRLSMDSLKGRLAWSFLSGRTLWGKYAQSRFKPGRKGCAVWTPISRVASSLKRRAYWMFGKGNMTVKELCNFHEAAIPSDCSYLTVKEAFGCDWYKFPILAYIGSAQEPFYRNTVFNDEEDRLLWIDSPNGNFETGRYKDSLREASTTVSWSRSIWKPWILPSISTFIWKMAHDGLSTDDNVSKLKIEKVSICFCCRAHSEDRDHLFLEGVWAKKLWDNLIAIFGGSAPTDINMCMRDWVTTTRKPSYKSCLKVGLVCSGLHHIWRNRNNAVHDEPLYPFEAFLKEEVRRLVYLIPLPVDEQAQSALEKLHFHSSTHPAKLISWDPGTRHLCVNIAVVNAGNVIKGGALVRNSGGQFIWGFSGVAHTSRRDESLFFFMSKVLALMKETGLRVDAIQSSHPLLSHLNNYHAGSLVHYRIEMLKREFGFTKCWRICSYMNQPAIALAFLGEEDQRYVTNAELPRQCLLGLEEDRKVQVWNCDGYSCAHNNTVLGRRHED